MSWPATLHQDQLSATNDMINQTINSGYALTQTGAINLGERGVMASVLANMLQDLATQNSITVPSTGGTRITGIRVFNLSLTPTAITAAAATTVEQLFTLTGAGTNLATGDVIVACNKPTATALLGIANVRVAGAGTLGIQYSIGIGSVTVAAEVYRVAAIRS